MTPRHGHLPPGASRGYALVLIAAACWAGGGLMAKWLFGQPGPATAGWPFPPLGITIEPSTLSAARAMVSFILVTAYLLLRRREHLKVRAQEIPFLVVFGVFGLALVHFAYFKTISLTGVAAAILLEYLAPILVLAVSVLFLGERLTIALPASVGLSVVGCALMVGVLGPGGVAIPAEGLAWGIASAVFFAGYTLMGRYAAGRFTPWTLLAYGLGAASLFWLAVLGGPGSVLAILSDTRALAAVTAMAVVSTVIPFGAFLKALHYIPATQASVTSTVEPVIAGVVAWVLFGEALTVAQVLGGGLVIVAVALSQARIGVTPEMPGGEVLGEGAEGA